MKRIFLCFILLTFTITVNAQVSANVTVNLDRAPAFTLIDQIEKSTGYQFYYEKSWLDSAKVTVHADNRPVEEVVAAAFKGTAIQFFVDGKRIILTDNVPILTGLDPTFFKMDKEAAADANYTFKREYVPEHVEAKQVNKVIEIGIKQSVTSGNVSLVGYVKEKKTGEGITGALVYVDKGNKGTITNAAGFYSLFLPAGQYSMTVQYTGMNVEKRTVILHSDGKLDILMEEDVISLKEVVIESEKDANVSNIQMGKSSIDMRSIKNVPKILGENDLLRVALTLPGVKSVGEGSSGLNVRGGNADQNLMQLNEATIYNTSHFLGFFSVFNADVIKASELYKSGIPAQYGGRLSSIFDVQMKDGNQNKFSGTGGIGPVTARLTLEVPIQSEKTSLIIGGRSTYSDWLLKQIPESSLKNSSASFYDLVARITHKINDNNSIAATYYYSKDQFKLGSDSVFSYSNMLASLQWRHSFNSNFHSNLNLTHSEYKYNIDYRTIRQNAFDLGFGIKESNFKWDLTYYKGVHKIDFGVQSKLYDLDPGFINPAFSDSFVRSDQVQKERGLENAIYVADNIDLTPKLSVYLGLRYSMFMALGPRTVYNYTPGVPKESTSVTDSLTYGSGKVIKQFGGPEYRISLRYSLPGQASLKASYNRTRQYIHMLSNTVSVSPTTTWKLSDPNVAPQLADQISIGYYKDMLGGLLEFSAETYYKWMNNVVDYKIGSELILNKHIERDILQGEGKAYGIELLLRKKKGKLNGWVSYTFSRTFLKMMSPNLTERVNNGAYYPANYDKPHDVSIVANYKFTRRYSLSANFVYNTGRPITYPIGQYDFGGGYKINYSDRNQFRIPDYIRLDLGINIEGNHKVKNFTHSFWSFSIYNILGRRNPYSIYFKSENGVVNGYKLSIFGAPIPTITYNFRF